MQTATVAPPSFNEPLFYTSYLDHYRSPLDLRSQTSLSGCSLSDISSLYPSASASSPYPPCGPSSQSSSRTPSFSASSTGLGGVEGIDGISGVDAAAYSMDGVEDALFENGVNSYTMSGPHHGSALSPHAVEGTTLAQGQVMMANVKQEKMFSPTIMETHAPRTRYGESEYIPPNRDDVTGGGVVCTDVVSRARKVLQQRQQMLMGEGMSVGRTSPSSDSPSPPSSPCSPLDEGDNSERYQLVTSNQNNKQITSKIGGHTFMDITPYMTLPQAEAARRLGIPPSTLSKRWRVAARKRKWPWRVVSKLDKEITTLMYNITPGETLDKEVEERLAYLMSRRQKELRPVSIRI